MADAAPVVGETQLRYKRAMSQIGADIDPLPRPAGDVVLRHRLPTRIWHWVNVVAFVVLLMSGLMIFNAHPRLYWGQYGANSDPAWLEIGSAEDRGYLRVGGLERRHHRRPRR